MDKQVSVSARALLVVGLMAVVLVAAYLVGSGRGQPANASDSTTGLSRTITVVGEGHVSVVPDQLTFDLAVDLTRSDLDTALGDTNTAMQHVVDTLEAKGVAKKDISTTDLQMNPTYSRGKGQPPVITGYEVTETVSVVVEDLSQASGLVTAAVGAGGTGVQLNGLQLQVGDPDAALTPARTAAYQQAKQGAGVRRRRWRPAGPGRPGQRGHRLGPRRLLPARRRGRRRRLLAHPDPGRPDPALGPGDGGLRAAVGVADSFIGRPMKLSLGRQSFIVPAGVLSAGR